MDIWTSQKRSEVMSRVKSHGNASTEIRLIQVFRAHRITGWRRRQKLCGNPDFVFRAERVCIFVDGCFWHGCPVHGTMPKSNAPYWTNKIAANKKRDALVSRTLRKQGWRVLRLWEHDLARRADERVLMRVRRVLRAARLASSE